MASNYCSRGSGDDTIVYERPVNYLNVFVNTGVTFSISTDNGETYMTIPPGFYSFYIGPVLQIKVQSNGVWQIMAIQS